MCGRIFANSAAVFPSLFEGLKDRIKRSNIHQINANLIRINHVLEFLKSISPELNAEVGKVRHQKLAKIQKLYMPVGFFFSSTSSSFFSAHTMDPYYSTPSPL